MPWATAIAICGEDYLRAKSTSQNRTHWRKLGVPWSIAGPPLLARLTAAETGQSDDPARRSHAARGKVSVAPLREAPMPHDYQRAEERLRALWWKTKGKTREWRAVEDLLAVLAPDPPVTVAPGVDKKTPAR